MPNNMLDGAQVIVDYLIRQKVPYAFGLCGHGNIQFIDALFERQSDIKTISTHHESVCGFMADVYYRVSGQPVATFTSCGPGSVNLPISLATAYLDAVPFLAVTGNVPTSQFGRGAFVRRAWARDNADTLVRYLAAYVESLRWSLNPRNKAEAVTMLVQNLKTPPDLAERTYQLIATPGFGFSPDAKLDPVGFKNVLTLRSEIEGGPQPAPERYLDLSYYDRAIKSLAR